MRDLVREGERFSRKRAGPSGEMVLPSRGYTGAEEVDSMELLPLRPLPAVIAVLALGSFGATLAPGSLSARCVR